ncbi:serine hydrolase [Aliiglaciecola sp. CAU 1673]|uniref:serine hydrolase n=1 Tax=Aliiglaciecola sp. CAU 1673 TaxID=3032595 RepID=UPI0023DCAB8B|nr:serine hydrolase [Aliiglaciecola sp. CAU 1673]MDF2179043.1 serine hydrolase [Aliiglaciecola sp. CAU 1673]
MLRVLALLLITPCCQALPAMADWLQSPTLLAEKTRVPLHYDQLVQPLEASAEPQRIIDLQGWLRLTPGPVANIRLYGDSEPAPAAQQLPTMRSRWLFDKQGLSLSVDDGLQEPKTGHWDYVIGHGRYWTLPEEQGLYVVAPLHLVEKNQNCVHNGVVAMRLPFTSGKGHFYYQITSETCAYFKADLWGTGELDWQPKLLADATDKLKAYRQRQASKLPGISIEQFHDRYPQADMDALLLKGAVAAEDISQLGWVMDNAHVRAACPSRSGDYPFCEQLLLPSFSTAKSFIAGNGLMYLEHRYPGLKDVKVSALVSQCTAPSWQQVSLLDLLNMRSGHYLSDTYMTDEGAAHSQRFFNAVTHEDKVGYACKQFPKQAAAGERFVYQSSQTYLLGTALQQFVWEQMGSKQSLIKDVIEDGLYRDLALSPIARYHRHSEGGVPFFGYGSLMYNSDLVAIARFTQAQRQAEQPRLDSAMLAQALPQGTGYSGHHTGEGQLGYANGYWALEVTQSLECNKPTWLAFMSGYGGVTVAFLPDNRLFYYFSDGHVYRWLAAVKALHALAPLCQSNTESRS